MYLYVVILSCMRDMTMYLVSQRLHVVKSPYWRLIKVLFFFLYSIYAFTQFINIISVNKKCGIAINSNRLLYVLCITLKIYR
jgi:hypothetical protein